MLKINTSGSSYYFLPWNSITDQITIIYEIEVSLTSAVERQMFEEYVKRKAV
jgi:hypothetical protein